MARERTSIRRMRGSRRMKGLLSIGCFTVGAGLPLAAWADGGAGGTAFSGVVPGGGGGGTGGPGLAVPAWAGLEVAIPRARQVAPLP
jgi:hypothetical protein